MHRLDFTMISQEPLQGAASQKPLIIPYRPKRDTGGLQSTDVQGMGAFGRCFRPRTSQMNMEEVDHAPVSEITLDNSDHARPFAATSYL
jgi:hypothetical protein